MKEVKPIANSWRTMVLILSFFLAILFVLASVRLMSADDGPQPDPTPDRESPYQERVLSERELLQMEPSLEQYMSAHLLMDDQLFGSDISQSTKEADREEVPPGGEIVYTIVISNSGDSQFTGVMTDELPSELTYVSHDLVEIVGGVSNPGFFVDGNTVTWGGALVGGGHIEFDITAQVNDDVAVDTMIVNTAAISDDLQSVTPSASVHVVEGEMGTSTLPFIIYGFRPDPPDITNFSSTRPNSKNEFTVSWTGGQKATGYELEMADNPEFNIPTVHN
ncbi:MAG: DUF11 domain-containing protein, partial [Candidatus Promineifilaceae bacterium]|nr:DUF11 domain-containing protein [Candidatus Promineifilaceae bacterium]